MAILDVGATKLWKRPVRVASLDNTTGVIVGAGTTADPIATATASKNMVDMRTKSTATSGDSRGVYWRHYLSGAGLSGESARFFTTVNNVAGDTAHGAHLSLSFGTSGSLTGLGVASRNTLQLCNAAMSGGTFASTQAEIWSDGSSTNPAGVTDLAFIRVVNSGNATGVGRVDDKANLFDISGGSDATGNLVYGNTIRCKTHGSTMYLVQSSTQGTLTFTPARGSSAYSYGVDIVPDDTFFVGGAATKSYLLSVRSDRPSGSAATGDSNDALIKISGSNYAANDTNFIFRGINAAITNRSGGTLGRIEHSMGAQGKSGGTAGTILGLTVTSENYGTVSDLFGGIDVILKNEAAVATTEFGIRISNQNNSIAGDVASAIVLTESGANTGFTNFVSFLDDGHPCSLTNGSTLNDISGTANEGWIKVLVGSTTRYIPLYAAKS